MLKIVAKDQPHGDSISLEHASDADIESLEPEPLSPQEVVLIAQLRQEANSEKDSFGWHAFQALSMSSIALGGILYLMFSADGFVAVGLAAVPILVFALMTCQLGDSSYSSANRHYGYELYLYRIRTISRRATGRWKPAYRSIEWEAAMRAWRVVQTTLYETVYRPGSYLRRVKARRGYDPKKAPLWFCQSSLMKNSDARPYAGGYLARMHAMLLLAALASVMVLFVAAVGVFLRPLTHLTALRDGLPIGLLNGFLEIVCSVAFAVSGCILVVRYRAEKARRAIMEDGLLSIHACAIVWQAVVVAHFSALERARKCGMTSWDLVEVARKARSKHRQQWKQWKAGHACFETLVDLVRKDEEGHAGLTRMSETKKEAVDGAGLMGYTFWLGEEAASLARCAIDVPGWVGDGERSLRDRGIVKRWNKGGWLG